jgi:phosphoribosylformylglycinamidine cyclo-ligase
MVNESYKSAGVDINAGYKSVELMKEHVAKTHISGVPEGLGGFGGLFIPEFTGMTEPVLVSGTDGVGTKMDIASLLGKYDTIGIDLVAMCVNDIICCGAKPLFFLDYISCVKNIPEEIAGIVKGIAEGCVQAGCALIGGETAEHSNAHGYDMAGFCVGMVDKPKLIGKTAQSGDVLLGLASSGVHSNGFSLVRKVFPIIDEAFAQTLLTPTKIYVKPILDLTEKVQVKGIANITGGGFYENIPRALPNGLTAEINKSFWEVPEVFNQIAAAGKIPEQDMFSTFNMGIGMVVVVDFTDCTKSISILAENGVTAFPIGKIIDGSEPVIS